METKVVTIIAQDYDEEKDALFVEVPLPEARKETIDLQVHSKGFTVKALREAEEESEYIGAFSLCCPVDQERVTASYEDGVLRVFFPIHAESARPRKVKIS